MSRRPVLVSVVIPALDAAEHIADQLAALSGQTYAGDWEVIVADNGSTDRTCDVVRSWADRLPRLRVVDASARRGGNYARRIGFEAAAGDFIAQCDADDVVDPGWIEGLVSAARDFDFVGGALDMAVLNQRSGRDEGRLRELAVKFDFLPSVPGGNCGIWADVARAVPWDDAFGDGGADVEHSWRVQLAGFRVGFAADALVHVRRRESEWANARRWFAYGKAAPPLFRRFAEHGMPGSPPRAAARAWGRTILRADRVLRRTRRRAWLQEGAYRLGRLVSSVRSRVWYL